MLSRRRDPHVRMRLIIAVIAIGDERMDTSSTKRFCFMKNPTSEAAHSGKKTTAAEGYAMRTVLRGQRDRAKKNRQQTDRETDSHSLFDHVFHL
jgi:hypothetical protein